MRRSDCAVLSSFVSLLKVCEGEEKNCFHDTPPVPVTAYDMMSCFTASFEFVKPAEQTRAEPPAPDCRLQNEQTQSGAVCISQVLLQVFILEHIQHIWISFIILTLNVENDYISACFHELEPCACRWM